MHLHSRARRFSAALLSAALLLLAAPSAFAAETGLVLRADVPESGVLPARASTPVRLVATLEANGAPVPNRSVHWRMAMEADAVLSRDESTTSAGGAGKPPAGETSVLFTPRSSGDYEVLAQVNVDPACTGVACEVAASARFKVSVPAAVVRDSGGHPGLTATLLGAGAVVAVYAGTRNDGGLPTVKALFKVSGDGQSAAAGSGLSSPLVVRATDDSDSQSGVTIQWTASGGAVLSSSSSSTDSSGEASVSVSNVGPGPGPVVVTATRSDAPSQSVSFSITVLNKTLSIVSGNNQSAPVSTQVPSPLVVEARLGPTPQSGIGITWAIVSGDATINSVSNGGNTNGSGQSSAVIDLGPTPGTVQVSATRNDAAGVTQIFTINSTLVRTLALVSGDNQTAAPNDPLPSPLVVHAQDNGNDAGGITINWSVTGGATLSSTSTVTNGAGQTSITVTDTGPGPDPIMITAVRNDDPTAQVIFNATLFPPVLSVFAGDNQTGLTGSVAGTDLEVLLVDGGSAPVIGQTISWVVTSGSAILDAGTSVTDGSGHAFMGYTFGGSPGAITIEASAYSGSQTVSFSATAVTASGVNKSGGDGQSGNPGQPLAPFVITIVPPGGVTDLSGVPVTFTITSTTGGSLSITNAVTDASGQASTVLTLGLTPGPVTVLAQVTNGPSTTFNATVNGSLVGTNILIISGDGQTLETGIASAPMLVELRNGVTPLPGLTLNWSSSNGSLSFTSTVTDVNGRASVTVTPSSPGAVIVGVNFAAFAQYTASSASFTHNTTLGSLPNLTTDEAAVAVALDNACSELSSETGLTVEEQDLLDQCEAMADASDSNPAAVASAIEELLPDVAKTQTQTGEAAVNAQFDNLKGRVANLRAGVRGVSLNGLTMSAPTGVVSLGMLAKTLADEEQTAAGTDFSKWGFFASGNIGRGRTDAREDSPRYDFDIRGLTAGVDYRYSDNIVFGVALGYTRQDTSLAGQQGSLALRGWSISGYSTFYREKSWYVDAALSLASNDYHHRRRISYVLPGQVVDQFARADAGGQDMSATLTLGRDFHRKEWNFGVYGRALYSRQDFDAFDEELDSALPGGGLALRIDSRNVNSLSSVFGGRATRTHSTSWGVVSPSIGLEWQREYSGDPDAFRAFLISDPTGTPILITGDALDSSYFRINLGVAFLLTHGRSGFIQYDRIFAREDTTQENLSIGIRIEF